MVGLGKRFSDAGFTIPKPLIPVRGECIVQHAVNSLNIDGNFIFIIRKSEHSSTLHDLLKKLKPTCKVIEIAHLTEGSVNSILLAKEFINNDDPLITTNCDQRTDWNSSDFLNFCKESDADGVVVTYPYDNIVVNTVSPYSFIELDGNGVAKRLEEKFSISNNALCGIHYWKRGKDFVSSAEELIKNNDRTNNEFYVAKTYNYLIKSDKVIKSYPLKKYEFHSLGTPEDVKKFNGVKNEFVGNKRATILCDLDGTILKHLHSYSEVTTVAPELLPGVREKFDEWDSKGYHIILLTARKESARAITEKALSTLGVPYDKLIMGLATGPRITINDKLTEDADRAKSVNIVTNSGFVNVNWENIGL